MHTVQSAQASQQATSNMIQAAENVKRNTVLCFDPEISMNFNSKVDKYFGGDPAGDFNGNFKLRQGDLQTLSDRKLSQSDPLLLNSCQGVSHVPQGFQRALNLRVHNKILTDIQFNFTGQFRVQQT